MKRCLQCNRTYEDEGLSFCLDDGAPLSISSNLEKTLTLSEPQLFSLPSTEAANKLLPTAVSRPARKSRLLYIAILIIVALLAGGGVALYYEIRKDNQRDELGKDGQQQSLTFPDGTRYEGSVLKDKPHGRGVMVFPSGDLYYGDFLDGKRNGQGIYTFKDSTRYKGGFLNDVYNGQGLLTFPDGRRQEGTWANGKFVGTQ